MSTFDSPSARTPSPALLLLAGAGVGILLTAAVAWWVLPAGGAPDGAPGGGDFGGPPGGFGASPVDVVVAVETIAAEPVQLLGTAAPVRQSLVASEVDGLAAEVRVDEGDTIRRGQTLVRLRTAAIEQQLAGATASKQESEARLTRARTDFERLASLLERRAISQREYDQAVADRDALVQDVARLEAELMRLQDQLDRATVRAPFSGRVTAVHVEVGEWVGRGDEIVSLVDLSHVEVGVQIAERFISAVQPGFAVDVAFDALPGRSYAGSVKAIVPEAVPEARTFPVLVSIDNRDLAIKGGMAARVLAQLGNPQPTVLVAKDAIVRRGDQVLVFRVAPTGTPGDSPAGMEGMIEQVSVTPGPARGAWQVVYGAIAAGDVIVVRGNERVFPGQPVVVSGVRELAVPTADPDRPIAVDPRSGDNR